VTTDKRAALHAIGLTDKEIAEVARLHMNGRRNVWTKVRDACREVRTPMADPIGYVVLTNSPGGGWDIEWDGELHADLFNAEQSAAAASNAWDVQIGAVVAVPSEQNRESTDER
jgi:hypothetical protein